MRADAPRLGDAFLVRRGQEKHDGDYVATDHSATRALIDNAIERKLAELLGDPDKGLELKPAVKDETAPLAGGG